ncbi:MAG: Inner rane component of cytoplasmic domain, partial [Bacteroidota bacterium]
EDFKSTNGTRINGTAIQGRVPVKHGDTLSVGTLDFELQVLATAATAQPKPAEG